MARLGVAQAPKMADEVIDRLVEYRSHPWPWLRDCVLTLDQADRRQPIKKFPADLPYIRPICDVWLTERLLLIKKSRRMLMSWLMMSLNLWDAMFHIGRSIYVVSDKEEKSNELLMRAKFVYDHIPDDLLPVRPDIRSKYCHIEFPGIDSAMHAVAQGADQLRQVTASRIFADEFAFWTEAEATYGAMRPTIEGGGQIVIVSTPFPGFFRDLVMDEAA